MYACGSCGRGKHTASNGQPQPWRCGWCSCDGHGNQQPDPEPSCALRGRLRRVLRVPCYDLLLRLILEAVRQELLHDLCIGVGENHGAACIANELVRTLDHAMTLTSSCSLDFAGAGDLEPLLGGRFGLHL